MVFIFRVGFKVRFRFFFLGLFLVRVGDGVFRRVDAY